MAELLEGEGDSWQGRALLEEPDHSSSQWYFPREFIESASPSGLDGIDAAKESYLRKSYCTFLQDLGMHLKVFDASNEDGNGLEEAILQNGCESHIPKLLYMAISDFSGDVLEMDGKGLCSSNQDWEKAALKDKGSVKLAKSQLKAMMKDMGKDDL